MIISRLRGGLGNQMFQYAAGLALAQRRHTVLKLDVSWFREHPEYEAHNVYGLHCFNLPGQFASAEELRVARGVRLTRTERWSVALARVLRFRQYAERLAAPGTSHRPPTFRFYPEFHDLPDGTLLDGMFQSERFFAPVAGLLRLQFTPRYPSLPSVEEMARRIAGGPSIAVHFRQGDYARNAAFSREMGVLNLDYYRSAVQLLRKRAPEATLYIFSDDIETVAREFTPPGPHEFVRCVQPWHPWDKLRLMSQCQHIAIANSTFSWWAAWLNPTPDKLVICPDPWFVQSEHDATDVVPAAWTRLPRH